MRKLVLGAVVAAGTAALSVPVIGLAGSPGSPILPKASAEEALPAFSSCDELLDWYVEKALPLVGPYGFGFGSWRYAIEDGMVLNELSRTAAPMPAARDDVSATKAQSNSATGTNVQEVGVDEPDGAKTDGKLIYRIEDEHLIVTDVTGKDPVELSRTKLPKEFWGDNLLLAGSTVLAIGGTPQHWFEPLASSKVADFGPVENSRILSFDVSDPKAPKLTSDQELEGTIVETRQYGERARVVLQSGYPALDFVQPNRRRDEKEATRRNKQIVRDSVIGDWLPAGTVDGKRSPLLECGDVRHPRTNSGLGTLSILTFDAATPLQRKATAVTTSGNLAYSSATHLYVATPVDPMLPDTMWNRVRPAPTGPAKTEIHAFTLDGDTTTYAASGTVTGTVRDRWSFDEHEGNLRVATALAENWETRDNAVNVLQQDGEVLKQVGVVRGIGPREDIQSVRWFDDLAVVVTFRQMDPLYTVDLTDPAAPKVLGELKIPGFSSYLHPLDGDRLLGLGTAATKQGRSLGGQVSTFDISDLTKPRQLDVLRLAREEQLVASYDPHGFTLTHFVCPPTADCAYAVADFAYAAVTDWNGGASILKLVVLADGTIREEQRWGSDPDTRVLPIERGRVALVGREVRIAS